MYRVYVTVLHPVGLFSAVGQHSSAFHAQRQVYRSRDFLARRGLLLDFLADRFDGGITLKIKVSQSLVLAQQAQQQMFGFDIRTSELARFVVREENHSARFFGVTLKHGLLNRLGLQFNPHLLDWPLRNRRGRPLRLSTIG